MKSLNPDWMRFFLSCSLAAFLVTPLAAAESPLRMGTAKVDVTPDEPVMLAGYGSRKEPSTGIHDRLHVRVVAFEQDSQRLVFVSTDVLGFYGGTYEFIAREVESELGVSPDNLFLSAIHTHSAPILTVDHEKGHPANVRYTETLRASIVSAIRIALGDLQTVRLGTARGDSPVGVNRREIRPDGSIVLGRNPKGVRDTGVWTLGMFDASGELRAVLYNYATHATSLGPRNLLVSGDLIGLAAGALEKLYPNATVAALIAASGDIDPWYRVLPGFRTEEGWIPETELLGRLLAAEVALTVDSMEPGIEDAPIASISSNLSLPAKIRGQKEVESGDDLSPAPLRLSAARLGNIAFLGISGEVLTEVGRRIRQGSPFPLTVIVTHCNGANGYLPPADIYPEGGYEVETSPFAPEAAGQVVEEALRLLSVLAEE
jgi:neutral ceramidase